MAIMSIMTLYNFDNTIFDNLTIPLELSKEDIIYNLLMELAELEIIYPNPLTMKQAIGFWSKKNCPIWKKLYDTTILEYNPIHNYDRTEESSEYENKLTTKTDSENRDSNSTDNEIRNLEAKDSEVRDVEIKGLETKNGTEDVTGQSTSNENFINNGADLERDFVSAFNETTPTMKGQKEIVMGSGRDSNTSSNIKDDRIYNEVANKENNETESIDRNRTDTGTVSKRHDNIENVTKEGEEKEDLERRNSLRAFGNIGVTTTQQMIESERDVVKFNLIDYIIEDFKRRFCIMIY